jgi:hypothetical protein
MVRRRVIASITITNYSLSYSYLITYQSLLNQKPIQATYVPSKLAIYTYKMANYSNDNVVISPLDAFERQIKMMIKELNDTPNKYANIGKESLDEIKVVTKTLDAIVSREIARHPRSETYNPVHGAADMSRRDQHTHELQRSISEWSKTLTNEQSNNDQYQQSAPQAEPYTAYVSGQPEPLFPGRDQGNVNSGFPSHGADDQASVARSRSSGRSAPYFCKFEGCPVGDKAFKFLSKLR